VAGWQYKCMGCKHTCSTPCPTAIFAVKRQTNSRRDQMQLSPNAFKRFHTANSHQQHAPNHFAARWTEPNTSVNVINQVSTFRKTQIARQLHHHPTTPMQVYPAMKHAAMSTFTSQQPTHNLHLHTKTDINIRNTISTSPQLQSRCFSPVLYASKTALQY
jgi:Fe-S-cluster-containing hydrogenase component 2